MVKKRYQIAFDYKPDAGYPGYQNLNLYFKTKEQREKAISRLERYGLKKFKRSSWESYKGDERGNRFGVKPFFAGTKVNRRGFKK